MMQFQEIPSVQLDLYYEQSKKALDLLKQLGPLNQENGWIQSSEKNGFKIHTKPDPITGLCYTRGEGFIPFKVEEIMEIIEAVENRPEYDELCESGHQIVRLKDDLMIFYQKFKSMFFVISSRDFVLLSYKVKEGTILYAVGTSIDYEAKPPQKGVVRGDLKLGGWILEEKDGGTHCIFITWADPKGNLPHKAVNLVASAQGQVVEKVRKLLEKKHKK